MKNQVVLSRTNVTFIRKSQDGTLSWVPDLSLATRFTIPEGAPIARQVGGTVVSVVAAEFMSEPPKKLKATIDDSVAPRNHRRVQRS